MYIVKTSKWKKNVKRRVAIKLCFKAGKCNTETIKILKVAYSEIIISRLWLWNKTAKCRIGKRKFTQTTKIAISKIKSEDNVDRIFDSKGIVYRKFVPERSTVNKVFCLSVLDCLCIRIACARLNLWKYRS